MNFGKALTFVYEDEDWIKKLLIGILLSFVPIFGQFAVSGYMLAIIRNVKNNAPRPLPEWSNVVDYFVEGLKLVVVGLVYSLPALLLSCPIVLVGVLPAFTPLFEDPESAALALTSTSTILVLACSCPVTLYSLFLTIIAPAMAIRLAETKEIAACLRPKDIKEIVRFSFANIGPIILSLLVVSAAILIVSTVSLSLLAIPAGVWLNFSWGHMCGQIARKAEQPAMVQ
jgi:hypothetical protein